MSVPIYGFYHVCATNNYLEIVKEQLSKLLYLGLLGACRRMYVSVLHLTDEALEEVDSLIDKFNSPFAEPKIEIVLHSKNIRLSESPVLNLIREHTLEHESNARIFYIHTKGVSDLHQSSVMQQRMKAWRQFMEAYTIERWRDCLQSLDVHDVCGVNYHTLPFPHFSGNFWWARSDYVRMLPSLHNEGDYSEPEQWICLNNPRVECFQESGINHFEEVFDVQRGIKPKWEIIQPKVAIYTAVYGKYDPFQRHAAQTMNCDFFYFSDKESFDSKVPITLKDVTYAETVSPIMKAKYLRVHPFDIPELQSYDIIIYLDGNIRIGVPTFIEDLLKVRDVSKYPLTVSRHPEIGCAYHEAQHARTFPKYANTDIDGQISTYEDEGFPRDLGFHCSGFLIWNRKFEGELRAFQERWWAEICKYNKTPYAFPECQISLAYCMWKSNLNVLKLPQYCYTPRLMVMTEHKR